MKNIKLYIGDKLVDFLEDIDISFKYQFEDLNNPSAIKNYFSKTITLPATKNNNNIFGNIYQIDRLQDYSNNSNIGPFFNPANRTDFKLFFNNNLIENGYCQLNNININGGITSYEVTLFGGIGDFFYNLAYFGNGETKLLKDIRYFVKDSNGKYLDKDSELDFLINKNAVDDAWQYLLKNEKDDTLFGFVNFMISNNGLYESFSNNIALINTKNQDYNLPTSINYNNTNYSTVNGYGLAKLNRNFTELESRDLRSYFQRPVFSLKKMLLAFFNKENNGGYEVELDADFFNDKNPYWENAYIALPLLSTLTKNYFEKVEANSKLKLLTNLFIGQLSENSNTGIFANAQSLNSFETSSSVITNITDGVIQISGINVKETNLNAQVPFSLSANIFENASQNDYFLSYIRDNNSLQLLPIFRSIVVRGQLENNITGEILGYSNEIYNFSNAIDNVENNPTFSTYDLWQNYTIPPAGNFVNVNGNFQKDENNNIYFKAKENDSNTFILTFQNANISSQIRINIIVTIEASYKILNESRTPLILNTFSNSLNISDNYVNSNVSVILDNANTKLEITSENSNISSNYKITKNILLGGETTPLDILLSYTKMFGLIYLKDEFDKKIYIKTKNSFFKNNIIDLTEKIDLSKEYKIYPLAYSNKFYNFSQNGIDSYYYNYYKNKYNKIYGNKKINTNYNFNNDTKEVFENNIFENVIEITDFSKYYRNFILDENNKSVSPVFYDTFDWVLYDSDDEEYTEEITKKISLNNIINYNKLSGYDIFSKICCFTQDNNEKNLVDLSKSLVFYNGFVDCNDINNNPISYWISDDIEEMYSLNDSPCILLTNSPLNAQNQTIAIEYLALPKFSRYFTNSSNNILYSFDFGLPDELFVNDVKYNESATIYEKFWKKIVNDKLDVNTKKITIYCYLQDLIPINYNMFTNFYYFNKCLWQLNVVEDYNIGSRNPIKCEFIKINDSFNYTNSQTII